MLPIVAKPAIWGVILATLPVFAGVLAIYVAFDIDDFSRTTKDPVENGNLLELQSGNWLDTAQLTKKKIDQYRYGRMGTCLMVMGVYIIVLGSQVLIPDHMDERLRDDARREEGDKDGDAYADVDPEDDDDFTQSIYWKPMLWKRAHMLFASACMVVPLVIVAEFSYSATFGDNIYQIIVALLIGEIGLDLLLEELLSEALLIGPLKIAFSSTVTLATLGADDLVDFLLSNEIAVVTVFLSRLAFGPWTSWILSHIPKWQMWCKRKFKKRRLMTRKAREVQEQEWKMINEELAMQAEGVEPLLDSYLGYSLETIALLMVPFLTLFLFFMKNATMMPEQWGITNDLMYYVMFGLISIPYQFIMDMFLLNALELAYGWKLYDYISYQGYRFTMRSKRWQLMHETLDESISEGLQTVDLLCFSAQYYFIESLHAWGLMNIFFAITTHLRHEYSIFSDPMLYILLPGTWLACEGSKRFLIWASNTGCLPGWLKLWTQKTVKGTLDDEIAEKLALGSADNAALERERLELQAMNSERFRHRFLDRTRPWVLQHLTELLTPRTLRQRGQDGRPNIDYIRDVYDELMKMGTGQRREGDRSDISSDDEGDDATVKKLMVKPLSQSSKAIAKLWLERARKRRVCDKLVAAYMRSTKKEECEKCGRTKTMGATMTACLVDPATGEQDPAQLSELINSFDTTQGDKPFDPVAWKAHFRRFATIKSLCERCLDKMAKARAEEVQLRHVGDGRQARAEDISSDDSDEDTPFFEPMVVARSSPEGKLMAKWLTAARTRLGGVFPRPTARAAMREYTAQMRDRKLRPRKRGGKRRGRRGAGGAGGAEDADPSMDQGRRGIFINAASHALAQLWLYRARDSLMDKERNALDTLMQQIEICLESMPATEDWYFTASAREEGMRLREKADALMVVRRQKEAEQSVKIRRITKEVEEFANTKQDEMRKARDELQRWAQSERQKTATKIEERLIELRRAQVAAKGEDSPTQVRKLQEQLEATRKQQEEIFGKKLAERKEELDEKTKVVTKSVDRQREDGRVRLARVKQELMDTIKASEKSWRTASSIWVSASKRKIEKKSKSNDFGSGTLKY